MNKLFYLLAIISLAVLIFSGVRLADRDSYSFVLKEGQIKGFEDVNANSSYTKLIEKFRGKIRELNDKTQKEQKTYFWVSFLVTALTASSTLVSALQASKSQNQTNPQKSQLFAIIIALLAFLSTLSNFASTHVNELKTEYAKKATDLITLRAQFITDYNKATSDTKESVVGSYDQRLD